MFVIPMQSNYRSNNRLFEVELQPIVPSFWTDLSDVSSARVSPPHFQGEDIQLHLVSTLKLFSVQGLMQIAS